MRTNLYALLLPAVLAANVAQAQVPNDDCANAIAISCGQTVAGNTTEATPDPLALDCGTSVSAAGIWYSFAGNGEAITLSTCINFGYDTKINVYTGSCGNFSCVAGNDDGGDCEVGSTVSFPSVSGNTYFILVQGFEGATGEFEMTVECGPITNDYCVAAEPIACNQSLSGSTLEATFDPLPPCGTGIQAPGVWYTFTGISDPVVISTCESFDYDTRINVFVGACGQLVCVDGNDDTPGVGTCSTVNFVPDPEEQYYILVQGYDGEVGNFMLELVCQTCGTPSDVSSTASDVSAVIFWQSLNPGATYEIEYGPLGFEPGTGTIATGTVNGANASATINGLDSDTEYAYYLQEICGEGDVSVRIGPFVFNTLADPPPVNAVCGGALPIACGGAVEGDTQASYFLPGITCGAANITAPGLWYTFTGTGETVTLSTCDSADFDTKISVYTGPCTDPSCVAGVDDAPGCEFNTSTVTFNTTNGVEYLVLVHGYNDAAGAFTMTMTCAPTCAPIAANDDCANAVSLTVAGIGLCDPIQGSNACAFATGVQNPPCDPFASIVDVWYSFNSGDQSSFTVSLGGLSASVVNAAVYTDCGTLEYVDCETEIDGPWQLNELEPNTTHYIRVWNSGGEDAGTFALCIETDLTTGILPTRTNALASLWPNPANHTLNVTGAPASTNALHVLDLQGRVALTFATNGAAQASIDISDLAPGTYVLRAVGTGATTLGRFVRE